MLSWSRPRVPKPRSSVGVGDDLRVTTLSDAAQALAARDPVVRRLAAELGPVRLGRPTNSPFEALVQSIVYQQLAEPAAHAIHRRLVDALGGRVEPEAIAAMAEAEMRAVGLSRNKMLALHDLTAKVLDGTLDLTPRRLGRLPDETMIEQLTRVRGIGPWSAQMFLIFSLRRLDVWPVLDLGVRRGYGIAWDLPTPTARELEPLGDPYRPYRTVIALYCWKADAASRPSRTGTHG